MTMSEQQSPPTQELPQQPPSGQPTEAASSIGDPRPILENLPPGVRFIYKYFKPRSLGSLRLWQTNILISTYFIYIVYHLSRKPFSIVKPVLHRSDCDKFNATGPVPPELNKTWCSWQPFEAKDYKAIYGQMDLAYWLTYAIIMFVIGGIAERCNIRIFLTAGMLLSGMWTIAFGMAYYWEIHKLSYFVFVQIMCGIVQATGWPVMIAIVGNWFGKARRGLIFGIWNSHSSIGNIFGSTIASAFVERSWALSFIVPGLTIAVGGLYAFFFVVLKPEDAGFPAQNVTVTVEPESKPLEPKAEQTPSKEVAPIHDMCGCPYYQPMPSAAPPPDEEAVSFLSALLIPGVVEFALCLFFSKAVSYVFLQWLPSYIEETFPEVGKAKSGYISTVYDLGGIVGGIIAGFISDKTGARGMVAFGFALLGAPMLWFLTKSGDVPTMIVLLIFCGMTVVGPYALITTAVSADLGSNLKGKAKALATVTGIVNGTGSFGSALAPLAAGLIAAKAADPNAKSSIERNGWSVVFYCLMGAQVFAALMLSRVVYREILNWRSRHQGSGGALPQMLSRLSRVVRPSVFVRPASQP